ncbi:DNA (cytosine-5-)-methyltransferase [Bifidobacterium primatium]|uniref:DNA (cytosine-5-)-methyltransferase n=1 Tax=Bifidobacterium primatium TaxID=2045438 RepID=A0A2M9HBC5_9BIFI|nr:DNA cytosine methyltransferase [Bifidobacterium primatium]PJM74122.1 DNA (cytosine-5-)-methyltransferase [Bifidobacterium primatium]
MRGIELFAGGGGLLLGSALAGFSHDAAIEWEHNSCETLRLNQSKDYPLVRGMDILESDVRTVGWSKYGTDLDLLAGGPPCQPFSLGGLARAALDPRDMFPAMTHALSVLRPRAFIVENVKGLLRSSFADYYSYILLRLQHPLLTAREDETWKEHLTRLSKEHTNGVHDELSYAIVPTLVDAANYGVAQHRHRVIIVGFRTDIQADWSFPKPTHSAAALHAAQMDGTYWEQHRVPQKDRHIITAKNGDASLKPWRTLRDALHGLPDPRSKESSQWLNHNFQPGAKIYPGHTGSVLDEPSKAIKAGVHGVPGGENMIRYPNGEVRYYSTREAARIQGFPDRYEFSGAWGETMRQIGNAVPVQLAQIVASSVAIALEEATVRNTMDNSIEDMTSANGRMDYAKS